MHPEVVAAAQAALADLAAKSAIAHAHAHTSDAGDALDLSYIAPHVPAGSPKGGQFGTNSGGTAGKTPAQQHKLHQAHMAHLQHLAATGKATPAQRAELARLTPKAPAVKAATVKKATVKKPKTNKIVVHKKKGTVTATVNGKRVTMPLHEWHVIHKAHQQAVAREKALKAGVKFAGDGGGDVIELVGPKGYEHGWVYVGARSPGAKVFHPQHGAGTVTSHDGSHVAVKFDKGGTKSFDAKPGDGKGRLAPRGSATSERQPIGLGTHVRVKAGSYDGGKEGHVVKVTDSGYHVDLGKGYPTPIKKDYVEATGKPGITVKPEEVPQEFKPKAGDKVSVGGRVGTVQSFKRRGGIDGAIVSYPVSAHQNLYGGVGYAPHWEPLTMLRKPKAAGLANEDSGRFLEMAFSEALAERVPPGRPEGGRFAPPPEQLSRYDTPQQAAKVINAMESPQRAAVRVSTLPPPGFEWQAGDRLTVAK